MLTPVMTYSDLDLHTQFFADTIHWVYRVGLSQWGQARDSKSEVDTSFL